jgi:hypothetical protein
MSVAVAAAIAGVSGTAFATVCVGAWHDPAGHVTQYMQLDSGPSEPAWPSAVMATVAVDSGVVPASALAVYDFWRLSSSSGQDVDDTGPDPAEPVLRLAPQFGAALSEPSAPHRRSDGLGFPFVGVLSLTACIRCERIPDVLEATYRVLSAFDEAVVGGTVTVGLLEPTGQEMVITYGDQRVVYSLGRDP